MEKVLQSDIDIEVNQKPQPLQSDKKELFIKIQDIQSPVSKAGGDLNDGEDT